MNTDTADHLFFTQARKCANTRSKRTIKGRVALANRQLAKTLQALAADLVRAVA
jgi:hypothetical protein